MGVMCSALLLFFGLLLLALWVPDRNNPFGTPGLAEERIKNGWLLVFVGLFVAVISFIAWLFT